MKCKNKDTFTTTISNVLNVGHETKNKLYSYIYVYTQLYPQKGLIADTVNIIIIRTQTTLSNKTKYLAKSFKEVFF